MRYFSRTTAGLFIIVTAIFFVSPGTDYFGAAQTAKGPFYPDKSGPFGYGIFEKIRYKHMVNAPTINIENPYLAGAELLFTWASVEPQEGRYDWKKIDKFVETWTQAGKKIILGARTVQKRGMNPTAPSATPRWVFDSGAKKITTRAFTRGRKDRGDSKSRRGRSGELKERDIRLEKGEGQGVNWPIYWDPVFLDRYEGFIRAFASQYDGHPGIEFVEIGLGQFGSTKIAGPSPVFQLYKGEGYTEDRWVATIKKIIDLHDEAFVKTPLAVVMSPFHKYNVESGGERLKEIAVYAADRGIYLYNHALTGNNKFVDLNPFPAIFKSVHRKTKTAFGPDNPLSGTRKRKSQKYGNIGDAVENAFGGIRGIPETYISYLLFYVDDLLASDPKNPEYRMEYEKAMQYAIKKLISVQVVSEKGF